MTFNPSTVLIILYYEERSEIFTYESFPDYSEIIRIKKAFLGSSKEVNDDMSKSVLYENLKREIVRVDDEEGYNNLIDRIKYEKITKLQLYIINDITADLCQNDNNQLIISNEISIDNNSNEINDIQADGTQPLAETTNHEFGSEEGNSTSLKSGKNDNEKFGIKKSEKHIKALFLWAKVAKSKFGKSDNRLISDDGNRKFNICANVSNKNVSLVMNDVNTKKKIKSKQILIYKHSFNFGWSAETGGEKLKNLILYLIKNFHTIDTFHDLSNF